MEYRDFNGKQISLLGFGAMRFTRDAEGNYDRPKAYALLRQAYEAGVNYFDTAYVYLDGESEKIVGEALAQYPRESYSVATKLPSWGTDTPEKALAIFEESLARLNMDYIDYYLLHAMNRRSFDSFVENGIVDFCVELKKQGRIKNLGFSFHDNYEAFEHIINSGYDWDFCQIQYNYMDQDTQATTNGIRLCEEKNIPLVIMEPIKGGTLANIPEDAMAPLKAIDENASASSWALRFVGNEPRVNVILSGMNEKWQLDDNLATFGEFKSLTDEEAAAVEKARQTILSRVKNGCTGCRYCMPCPGGVDIPRIFGIWNEYGRYGNPGTAHGYVRMKPEAKADNCLECGACMEKCPQGFDIIENLKLAKAELEAVASK